MVGRDAVRRGRMGAGGGGWAWLGVGIAVLSAGHAAAQNVIDNGGFEAGNVGFSSDYGYSAGGNCCEGQYTVRSNGSSFNGFFDNPSPSSPGSVLMMVVNGSTTPNQRVWFRSVAVTPETTYDLRLRGCTAVAGGPAILQWQVDGDLVDPSAELPEVTKQWVDLAARWTAPEGVTSIQLAVRNLNTGRFPNDFYMDDLSMTPVGCGSTDFDGDGDEGTDSDIEAFFVVLAGGTCPTGTCGSIDFDGDGDEGTDADIEAFFRVIAGGEC
jgi:hypothetical protein